MKRQIYSGLSGFGRTGNRFGRKLFQKEDSWLFHKKQIVSAQRFYNTHGRKAIVLARFVPIAVGIAAMNYRTFISFNVMEGLLWTFGLTLLGYSLGTLIPDVDQYLLPIILIIIVVSLLPSTRNISRIDLETAF